MTDTLLLDPPGSAAPGPIALPSKYHQTTFELDGRAVPITISVLSLEQQQELETGWEALRRQPGETFTPTQEGAQKLARLQYCAAAIRKHVRVKPGALVDPDEDNAPIVTGEQIVAALGRREDAMLGLFLLILWENGVGPQDRKLSKSALGSVIGWLTWVEPGAGPVPEPTVPGAEPNDAEPAEGASAPPSESSSIAGPSPSSDAPSAV